MALRSRPNLVIDPRDLKKLADTLKGFENDFMKRENHAVRALKRAAEPLRLEMGDKAPVDSGLLSESFRSEKLQRKYIGSSGKVFGKEPWPASESVPARRRLSSLEELSGSPAGVPTSRNSGPCTTRHSPTFNPPSGSTCARAAHSELC